jgi:hypothetical protein
MTKYFKLGARPNEHAGRLKKEANLSRTLINGRPVKQQGLVTPWPLTLLYEESVPLVMSDYYASVSVMSDRLIATLQQAGVDNLELFDAKIVVAQNNAVIPGYRVVNIVGLVAASDPGASKTRPLAHVKYFEKLVLDETRARGLLMFRLAESLIDVIVAESIAQSLRDGRFVDVTLEEIVVTGS